MPINPRITDEYLSSLLATEKEIRDREDDLGRREMELREERHELALQRQEIEAAIASYRKFLAKKDGRGPSAGEGVPAQPKTVRAGTQVIQEGTLKGLSLRIGEQRLRVLEALGRLHAESRSAVPSKLISKVTGLKSERVGNVLFEDKDRGIVEARGHGHIMTSRGYAFLRALNSPVGVLEPKIETPTTRKDDRRPEISGNEVDALTGATTKPH